MFTVTCVSNMPYLTGDGFVTDKPLINLTVGKFYRASWQGPEPGEWLRVWDDFGEDYLYPAHMFEVRPVA